MWNNVDVVLPTLLAEDVIPIGVLETVPLSGMWREADVSERPSCELQVWEEPWGSGLQNPAPLEEVVEADVAEVFAAWVEGGRTELEEPVSYSFGSR